MALEGDTLERAFASKGDVLREPQERVTWTVLGTACGRKGSQEKEAFH